MIMEKNNNVNDDNDKGDMMLMMLITEAMIFSAFQTPRVPFIYMV